MAFGTDLVAVRIGFARVSPQPTGSSDLKVVTFGGLPNSAVSHSDAYHSIPAQLPAQIRFHDFLLIGAGCDTNPAGAHI